MSSRPFMPLFCGDFLGDTLELSAGDFGRYMLLCMAYWQKGGPLSDDDRALGQITRSSRYVWQKTRKKLASFFTIIDGKWHHKRVDSELAKIKHRNDLHARNAAPRALASRARTAQPYLSHIESTPPPAGAAPEDRAPPQGRAPPPAGDSIFDQGKEVLGNRRAGLVGIMLKRFGADRVRHALREVEEKRPRLRSPPAFFRAVCEGREAQPPPADPHAGLIQVADKWFTPQEYEIAKREALVEYHRRLKAAA